MSQFFQKPASLSPLITMSIRTRSQTRTQPLSQSHPPPTPTAAAATNISDNPSSSSKIPFRPRKIQKLSNIPIIKPPKPLNSNPSNSIKEKIPPLKPLTYQGEIDIALDHLRNSDPLLINLINSYRPPAFDSRGPPFLSLARSILYQQLATNAAKSIYTRFLSLCGGEDSVLPDVVLSLSASQLRQIGVSGRKASYLHDLSDKYKTGVLSDSSILEMDDEGLLAMLTMVKGIGVWSVHMFMIFSLHRPDVLPVGDLGVRKGVQLLHRLKELPRPLEMEEVCDKWKPYRSVGAWYMWRFMEAKGVTSTTAAAEDLVNAALPEQQQP